MAIESAADRAGCGALPKDLDLADPSLLKTSCHIDGQWVTGARSMPVTDPATGAVFARVPSMGAGEARQAVEAARRAMRSWRARTAADRSALLRKWFDQIQANREDLARILTAEQGKPLQEARGEIAYAASYVEWYAEEAKRVYGETIPAPAADQRIIVAKEPVGVCAAIISWNFPSALVTRKVAPALAAGCAIVVRPSSKTPLSAFALAELAARAGIPPGVFSVVTGPSGEVGSELCENPLVRKVTFTGSTEVGRQLMATTASTVKKVSMELGGNASFIVFDDADVDAAVRGAVASKFRNAGQTCVCTNRIYVQAGVHEEFARKLCAAVEIFAVGPGTRVDTQIGPLIDEAAVAKVEEHLDDARAKGARVLQGGRRHALGGTFFEPTVIAGARQDMAIAREETFGPVAALFRFETEDEVIDMANDTEYGLASYFFSRDVGRAWRVAERLECGIVGVNTGIISTAVAPFGGVKQSGVGREGSHFGMDDYLVIKYINMAGI